MTNLPPSCLSGGDLRCFCLDFEFDFYRDGVGYGDGPKLFWQERNRPSAWASLKVDSSSSQQHKYALHDIFLP
jgi:hypothetical protein